MEVHVDHAADVTTWTLGGDLTIYDVRDVHEIVLGDVPATQRLVIRAEAVEEIDTAGLQWLLAVHRWAKSQDIDFLLELGDSAVIQLLDLYHAHGLLGLPAILVAGGRPEQETPDAQW